ncbi:hypothetical protein [Helicobacter bizzozeronii]|uniref:hypothetical protein n=1 Tax=Helicobacter bizzozeronii TaxID=56877 RepID=UPI0013145A7B|nr:hypothetical protein [Helicobacter bizzozeronii]
MGSGGVFARRKMANADELVLPHRAQVIDYDNTAVDRVEPPQDEDKNKPLGQYLEEQLQGTHYTIRAVYEHIKGKEQQIMEEAYGVKLTERFKRIIDTHLEQLDPEQKQSMRAVCSAVNWAQNEYITQAREEKELRVKMGASDPPELQDKCVPIPEWQECGCYQYSLYRIIKTAYAYAMDQLNNGLSVFVYGTDQDRAIKNLEKTLRTKEAKEPSSDPPPDLCGDEQEGIIDVPF